MSTLILIKAIDQDLEIIQGDTFGPVELDFFLDDGITPVDVSNWSFKMNIRSTNGNFCFNQVKFESWTIGNGIKFGVTTNEIIILKIPASVAGNYRYALTGTEPNGNVTTWMTGSLIIESTE